MSDSTGQILVKNIWELENRIKEGHGDPQTRLSLLRAYALQLGETENALGIPRDDQEYLMVNNRSRNGVLLLHGSTGGPAQLRGLAHVLYQAGFSVLGVRMPAHPAEDRELATHSWRAWLNQAENRYRMLATWCRQIHVIGFSFGASIALQMNVRPRPRSLVLLAPALYVHLNLPARVLLALGLHRRRWLRRRMGWKAEVLEGIEEARKSNWWEPLPLYVAMCEDDPRVSMKSVEFFRGRARNDKTRFTIFPQGGHVFLDGKPKETLQREILDFLGGREASARAGK